MIKIDNYFDVNGGEKLLKVILIGHSTKLFSTTVVL
jgi:hypothetical protein